MAHIILPSRRLIQPSGAVQLRSEFEHAAVWLFNGHHGDDKKVTTLGSFRATIEKSFPTADASMLVGGPGRFGIRDESASNFVGSWFNLAAHKTYLQPASQVAVLVVFTHILVSSHSAQVWMSSHNRYNNQYGYRFDIPTGTNSPRWWTGNASWTWNISATDAVTAGTRYALMGMSIPNAGKKELHIWRDGRQVAFDNGLTDFTITYSGVASDPSILGARYDGSGLSLGTTPLGPVEMIAHFGSGLSPALAQALTQDPYQMFEPAKRRLYFFSAGAAEVTGSAAITEGADTASASASIEISGSAAVTEANDTATASATAGGVEGSAAVSESADTAAGTGVVSVDGSAAATEGADTASSSAVVSSSGSAAITEANDTSSATGVLASSGSAAATEADDTASASGVLAFTGSAAVSEAADTASSSAVVSSSGSAAVTEANDTANANGVVGDVIAGSASITEAADTASANATIGSQGSGAVTEANDSASAAATIAVSGSAAVAEDADFSTASAWTPSVGSATLIEDPDVGYAVAFVLDSNARRRRGGPRPMPKDVLELYVEQQLREIQQRELDRVLKKGERLVTPEQVVQARKRVDEPLPTQPTEEDLPRALAAILKRTDDRALAQSASALARLEIDIRNDEDLLSLLV